MGNDYAKLKANMSFATIPNKPLPKLVVWDAKNSMKICNDNLRHKISPEHTIELNKSINLIWFPSVLTDDNELNPMNKMPMSNLSWG